MEWLPDTIPGLIYIGIALGPFVQEDAAVLAAASLSVNEMRPTTPIFIAILIGLILSDIWKYWIGWAALRNPKARAFAEKKHAVDLGDKVNKHLLVTLIGARFVPLSRIPAYIACGFFGVSYPKFCLYIALTAFAYVSAVFAICHALGEIMGEQFRWLVPIIGVILAAAYIGYIVMKRKRAEAPQPE